MVKGCDVSHWNQPSDVLQKIRTEGLRFMFIKATEGVRFVDNRMELFNKYCELNDVMPGFYHYARPENGNTAEQEAHHFCSTVEQICGRISKNNDGLLLALDWEGEALNCDPKWAIEWCRVVQECTGITPGIYTGYSYVHDSKAFENVYSPDGEYDFWLWIARWNNRPFQGVGAVDPWKFAAFHQYTSSDGKFDFDAFNGDESRLALYGKSKLGGSVEIETRPCQCGC